jgi:hypothetical protein
LCRIQKEVEEEEEEAVDEKGTKKRQNVQSKWTIS